MSEPTEATQPNAAPAVPPTTEPAKSDDRAPAWLPERIEQAKRSAQAEALRVLGVDSLDAAKAAVAKARELEEQSKSELQRLNEKVAALDAAAKRATELDSAVSRYADAELAKLTDAQRAAVVAIAGDDKARALSTIDALRPTWVAAASAPTAPSAPAPAPIPAPANTAQKPPPAASAAHSDVDHKATYDQLKASNPVLAAQYLSVHRREIFPS